MGRANFNLIRPVKPDGGTEQSYAGLRVPRVAPGRASNINLTDPQTTYQRTQGDGIQTLGGYEGNTTEPQMTVAGELISDPREKKDGNVKAAGLINGIGDIGSSIAQAFGNGRSPRESNLLAKYFGGFRANGGPMKKGKAYMVGEKGPELVIAEEDSTVIPRSQLASDPTIQTLGGYEGEQATEPPMTVAGEMISDPRGSEVVTSDVSTPSVAEKLKAELDRRQNKDFKKGGKDRDKDHNVMDVIRSIGLGALKGIASGRGNSLESILGNALGGAAGGGIAGAVDASADEKMGNEMAIAKLQPQYAQAAKAEADARESKLAEEWKHKQMSNIDIDNAYNLARLEEVKNDRQRKIDDRESKERTSRMNTVAGILNKLPAYDPNDPKFAELTAALKDANLPLTPKDAKKVVKMIQDQRTGDWSVSLTDPVTLKNETRPVLDANGKQFSSTPTVVMQGELGLLKQNDQQEFAASEADKNRQLKIELQKNAQKYGKDKTIEMATMSFKRMFQAQEGRMPTQAEINDYLGASIEPMFAGSGEYIPQ